MSAYETNNGHHVTNQVLCSIITCDKECFLKAVQKLLNSGLLSVELSTKNFLFDCQLKYLYTCRRQDETHFAINCIIGNCLGHSALATFKNTTVRKYQKSEYF